MGKDGPEWLCVAKDFSHDGIYFLADDHGLREKMQLLLSFPYIEHSPVTDREYLVEVIRVNRMKSLFQPRCGVGAKLILPMPMQRYNGLLVPEIALSSNRKRDFIVQHIDTTA